MHFELLKNVLFDIYGKNAVSVVEVLHGKKKVNEFDISKKLEITINQVRNILYKLSDTGLVSSTRKKDKKKGWYTYFWTLESEKSLDFLKKTLTDKIKETSDEIKSRSHDRFYHCETCNLEVDEEAALLNNFICPECEEVYALRDDKKLVSKLERAKEKFIVDLKIVDEELEVLYEKDRKKKEREQKKIAKEKAAKREEKKQIAAKKRAAKKKLMPKKKKKVKKKVKKKTNKKIVKKKKKVGKKKTVKKTKKKKSAKKVTKKKKPKLKKLFKKIKKKINRKR
jgi:transcription factor E